MAGSVGSVARYQILMALWASKGTGISQKDIVAAMGVTRPTVSGLMAALERDGLVKSTVDGQDRRKQIARLTAKGEAVIKKQHSLTWPGFVRFSGLLLQTNCRAWPRSYIVSGTPSPRPVPQVRVPMLDANLGGTRPIRKRQLYRDRHRLGSRFAWKQAITTILFSCTSKKIPYGNRLTPARRRPR